MPKKIPPYKRELAIKLRVEEQMTVPDIATQLDVSKATVHGWLKEYPLEQRTQKQIDAQVKATQANQDQAQQKRDDAYQKGWDEASELLRNSFFRDFVNLYMAEGFKNTIHSVCIANSDPYIMQMAQYFILKYANPNNTIRYEVQIHADQVESEIQQYRGQVLNIPRGKSLFLQKRIVVSYPAEITVRNTVCWLSGLVILIFVHVLRHGWITCENCG